MISTENCTTTYDDVAPDPSAMIESMRAHGYTLQAAVADLIDNSIAAKASNVWLTFEFDDDSPWIAITDDGSGMNEKTLVNAMRLGSSHPLDDRDPGDLGRFGLGLKTASFSQARRLTVITRSRKDCTFVRRWDLDHLRQPDVKGWQLLRSLHSESAGRADFLDQKGLDKGTQVLLEVIDRLAGDSGGGERRKDRENHFLWLIEEVRSHLSMVFHRFLERRKGGLKIFLNEEPVHPWDPFLEKHPATQPKGEQIMKFSGHAKPVRVEGWVLPHRDRFDAADEHRRAGGPRGWNAQQGFYIYRADRLIIAGDWLRLKWQKEEHFKLARIQLDIPNSMDREWQIDVKKSTATPPAMLKDWLRGIAQEVRLSAKEVYSHRGKYGPRKKRDCGHETPWRPRIRQGGDLSYRIDRNHPVLLPLIAAIGKEEKAKLELLLRLIEETVPIQKIWIDAQENKDAISLPFAGESSTKMGKVIDSCFKAKMEYEKVPPTEVWDLLAGFAAFQNNEAQAIIAQRREECQ